MSLPKEGVLKVSQDQATERRRRLPLVMAYVPWQEWGERYDGERGFELGTVFPNLYYPFEGSGVAD